MRELTDEAWVAKFAAHARSTCGSGSPYGYLFGSAIGEIETLAETDPAAATSLRRLRALERELMRQVPA